MRLRRLDLTRFGAFTNVQIDFGAAGDAPDLHIIYGPNEAGKSTLRAALGDLLFGIPVQSDHAFLHDYKAMEIGATVETGGQSATWRRVKRRNDDLLDAEGRPANRAVLDAALGGMDRKTFELMFSLDGETLKEGGEELYRSRGRLGEALFAATSGLSSISAALEGVRGEAEAFFKPRGKKQRLNTLKRELDDVDTALKQVAVSAPQYRALVEAFNAARAAHENAKRGADSLKARREQLRRWQNAMREWAKLRLAREKLAPLHDTPDIPEDTAAHITELDAETARLRRDTEQAARALERLSAERDKLAPDQAVLAEAGRIDRLIRMESGYSEARDNRPAAEHELAAEQGRLSATLEALGVHTESDPRDLLLPAPLTSQLDTLIRAHDGIATAVESAKEEAEQARTALTEIAESEKALGDRVDPAIIQQLNRDARGAQAVIDTSDLEEAVASARAKCDAAFAELHPWTGGPNDLRALRLPDDETLNGWREVLDAHRDARDQAARRHDDLAARAADCRAMIDALKTETGLLSEADIADARKTRDARWRSHRNAIAKGELAKISESADMFESALEADDQARAARERHSDSAARLRQLATDAAEAETAAKREAKARDKAQAALEAVQDEIDRALAALDLPAGWQPERISRWIEARTRALSAQDELDALNEKLARQHEARAECHERLCETLCAADAAPSSCADMALEALREQAEAVAKDAESREIKRAQKHEEHGRAKARLGARERKLAQAREAQEDWASQWAELMESCWLGAEGRARGPAEVREILKLLDTLRAVHERTATLNRDIARWRETEQAFTTLCQEICAATGMPFDERDPARAVAALREGLETARDLSARRKQTEAEIERTHEGLAETRAALDETDSALGTLAAHFEVPDIETLRGAIESARDKASIARDITELEESLRAAFDGRPLAEIEDELRGCDADHLAVEAQDIAAEIEARESDLQQLYHDMKKAEEQVEAVGADDKAAELGERRRFLLLQIEEETRRYLRLMAGVSAAEAALRLYRDEHRSAMMLNAARRFRRITGGRFTDLQARPDKDGETLVAIKADGGSLLVDGMSDGTRDQLYLALRMAGYEEFAATRAPLPFIADDILQSFDDDRAHATFEMLADIAKSGQVIYLTHHAHLCTLARKAVGTAVTVHELPGPGSSRPQALNSAQAG